MLYFLRVRPASFFAGAATASSLGMYFLYKDYKIAQDSIVQQMNGFQESLDARISTLEKLRDLKLLSKWKKQRNRLECPKI